MQEQHNYHETCLKHTPLICKTNDFHLKIGNSGKNKNKKKTEVKIVEQRKVIQEKNIKD